MIDPRSMTTEQEREALETMIESDGWAIYMAHVDAAWGHEACEAQMRKARDEAHSPDVLPFVMSRILDTFSGLRADLRWPMSRVRALKDGTAAPAKFDPFGHLRRMRRRA